MNLNAVLWELYLGSITASRHQTLLNSVYLQSGLANQIFPENSHRDGREQLPKFPLQQEPAVSLTPFPLSRPSSTTLTAK